MSSAGIEARQALRLKEGLVEALLYLVRGAIDQNHMDNKSVENVICVLRNLSYRCEEVVNPNYDKQQPPGTASGGAAGGSGQSRATAQHSGQLLFSNIYFLFFISSIMVTSVACFYLTWFKSSSPLSILYVTAVKISRKPHISFFLY